MKSALKTPPRLAVVPTRTRRRVAVPKHLRPATRKWFASVVELFELEEHHVRLLTMACEAWDRCQQAREILEQDGLRTRDRYGTAKAHPMLAVERDCRLTFARLLRELDLDADTPPDPSRPPAIRSNKGTW